ncbi:McrC family protein [Shewanella mangrovisoli]|uniref:McrC family protein n=2 Tax=Shewanella TaxID=22 RepID=A0ABV4VN60_9GAMM
MKTSYASVFEFGYLCADEEQIQQGYTYIPDSDFADLERRCLTDDNSGFSQIMQPRIKQGCHVLQVQNYVGVIFVPSGRHIEVLPKTGIAEWDDANHSSNIVVRKTARKSLLMMLQSLREFRHIALDSSDIETLHLPLLEIFIARFLDSVNTVRKRGLRSDYVEQQENLLAKRGKLNVSMQIKHNFVHKQRFYCEFDEYLQNRPANRLIKSALLKVQRYCHQQRNQRLLNELLFYFDEIPVSTNIEADFSQLNLIRGMNYYQAALAWTRLILHDQSPVSMKGQSNAPSLLFPMESVFEAYVAQQLRTILPAPYSLRTQSRAETLAEHQGEGMFTLQPDMIIEHRELRLAVLDTKWKRINAYSRKDKYGLYQGDFYQMFAYGHKYLSGKGTLALIYPKTQDFREPIEHCFDFDKNGRLILWLIPFTVSVKDEVTKDELHHHEVSYLLKKLETSSH